MTLNKQQLNTLRRTIETRSQALSEELHGDAARLREETYAAHAGPVPDPGDESVADTLADLGNAELSRDLAEWRELQVARKRIETEDFGVCADCGGDIPYARLAVQPAALRCTECQSLHEKTFAHAREPKL